MSMKAIVAVTAVLLAACSGKAIVDAVDGGGSGGSGGTSSSTSSGTSSSTSTSGTAPTCGDLLTALTAALDAAMACDTCDPGPNPCSDNNVVFDQCGCSMPGNTYAADAVAEAAAAYAAWVDQGCGPYDCPCVGGGDPYCAPTPAGCIGICGY